MIKETSRQSIKNKFTHSRIFNFTFYYRVIIENVVQLCYCRMVKLCVFQALPIVCNSLNPDLVASLFFSLRSRCAIGKDCCCISIQCSLSTTQNTGIYVTGYEKTRHMGYFVKIQFTISLVSTTYHRTNFPPFETDCVFRYLDRALFVHLRY